MLANYHTHTPLCHHATGSMRDYVEQAIAAGMQVLGFSDHAPYPFPVDYTSNFRMELHHAEKYFRTLSDLKAEYAGQIELHIGAEVEYYPDWHGAFLSYLRDFPCEYLLLGQHFLGLEPALRYSAAPHTQEWELEQYVSQTLEGLSQGCFTCLAHPDVLTWRGDRNIYQRQMRRICEAAKSLSIPLEINLQGLHQGRFYPNEAFWEVAGAVGNQAILGCDAHEPAALNLPEVEAAGRALAARHGVILIDRLAF